MSCVPQMPCRAASRKHNLPLINSSVIRWRKKYSSKARWPPSPPPVFPPRIRWMPYGTVGTIRRVKEGINHDVDLTQSMDRALGRPWCLVVLGVYGAAQEPET